MSTIVDDLVEGYNWILHTVNSENPAARSAVLGAVANTISLACRDRNRDQLADNWKQVAKDHTDRYLVESPGMWP